MNIQAYMFFNILFLIPRHFIPDNVAVYCMPNKTAYLYFQVVVDTGLNNELFVNLSAPLSNISFRVCAYTTAGQGPWTSLQTITLIPAGKTTEYIRFNNKHS